jgi:hypothetical protein
MKVFATLSVCLFLLAGLVVAAPIDGKWVSERKMERDGQSFTIIQTFDLKADGSKLAGSLTMAFGDMEPRKMDITDGKVDGNKFSFSVTMSTPNGEFKTVYEGAVEGDMLKGSAAREGGQSRPFEAKKK